jgi:hypothetical protein
MTINIDHFNFRRNDQIIKELEEIGLSSIPIIFYEVLDLTKKSKYHHNKYIDFNNISIEKIVDKLEDEKIQKKIIKKITNYKKIPKKTIDYFKIYNNKISNNELKQFIIDYLRIKYNDLSIFNLDINFIYFEGWENNTLLEEGPKDYIIERIKEVNKSFSFCNII